MIKSSFIEKKEKCMVCVVNQFMGTLNVHGAGFSPNPYLNSLSETLDQMNRQFQQTAVR